MTRRSSSVTIRDVAREAGVSVATVSRYINKNAPISTEVADRLQQIMSEMKYVPHAAARHLASRKTRVIGLLLNNLHNDFFVPLLNGVEAVVRKKGYNLIIATSHVSSPDRITPMDCWFFLMVWWMRIWWRCTIVAFPWFWYTGLPLLRFRSPVLQ